MSIEHELGFLVPLDHVPHETLMNIVLTGQLLTKEGHRVLAPQGLTDAHFNVLMLLKYQSPGGRCNQSGLGRMMLVNRSNITGLVDRMTKAGLVRRVADPDDRRVNYVEITEKGHAVLVQAHAAYYARIGEVMATLSESECNQLCTLLGRRRGRMSGTHKGNNNS